MLAISQLSQASPSEMVHLVGILTAVAFICLLIAGVIVRRYLLKKAEIDLALRKAEMESELKSAMIERGMPAQDIERVLAAKLNSH